VIKIIDNFFEEIQLKKIQNHVQKLPFTPRYYPDEPQGKESYYGARFNFSQDLDLLKFFTNQAENKFKIKIKDIHEDSGIDIRNLDHFKPHNDDKLGVANILVMLKGPRAVTNGTVFYTDKELDMHIGFKENRSVLFPSNVFHSSHASNVPNVRRYTATLFVKKYEDLI
jgi:hypothetical protein|tara:strand:- start:46 stop:552 length:507 start_codon:yes stop_codon:yes gene_type:complete